MNLLPEKIKSEIRAEYHRRLITVSLMLLSALLFLGLLPLLLLYITTSYRVNFLKQEIATMNQSNQSGDVVRGIYVIRSLNNKLNVLDKPIIQEVKGSIHSIVLAIIDTAKEGIRIDSFSLSPVITKKGSEKRIKYVVNVAGVADRRDTLLQFAKRLEANGMFSGVDLPISNLVESKNPIFSIAITLASK